MTLTMKSLQEQINELRNEVAVLKAVENTRKIPAGLSTGDTFKLAGLKWYKLVKAGRMTEQKFYEKYNAWKNHAMHGNCIKLCHSMDLYVKQLFEREVL